MSLASSNNEGNKMKAVLGLTITVVLISAYTISTLMAKATEAITTAINAIH